MRSEPRALPGERAGTCPVRLLLLLALLASLGSPTAAEGTAAAPVEVPSDLPIMASAPMDLGALASHVRSKNPAVDSVYLSALYHYYADECATEGVSLLVALSQMVHETDYLLFTGAVSPIQYNYAGLGATSSSTPGLRFESMRLGVRAHVQHLKAYGSTEPLARALADPRFSYVTRGSAVTVRSLAGRWAADAHYGDKVLAHAARLLALSR